MSSKDNSAQEIPLSLETVTNWARSNRECEKVYRYIFLHPKDFFVISPGRRWSIAHQVVFHGDVDLFKRILVLFSDDQINIRSEAADGKTLLDVATEKRNAHPAMYTYVEHLFAQDELINVAKNSNWRSVTDILDKNRELANEKPPYSPCFLLHYVVQNGDAEILQQLLNRFQFLTNVLNVKNETPFDMAKRLNKYDMCSILEPTTIVRPHFPPSQPQSPPTENLYRPNKRSSYPTSTITTNEPPPNLPSTSMPPPPSNPLVPPTHLPCIGFGNIVLDISQNGNFTVGPQVLFNSARGQPPPPPVPQQQRQQQPQQQAQTGFQHVHMKKTIISELSLTNLDPPSPPLASPSTSSTSSNTQLMKNLTCFLTRQIFVDPVIANDGQTYERAAILDWVNTYHCSPITGASMDATFRDNTEVKQIIQSIEDKVKK